MALEIGDVSELGIESEKVCAFYKKHWKRKVALAVPSFYDWQFSGSPSDAGHDHCMVAVDDVSKEILGVMGLNKRSFYFGNSSQNGAELTTWIVDEKHIGKGIGSKILKEIQARYDVLVGMGISEMALPIYMRSNFRYLRAIPRFIKILNFEAVEPHAKFSPWVKKLLNQWSKVVSTPYQVTEVCRESVRGVNSELRTHFNHFSRDPEFLEWRYTHHPVFKYKQIVIHTQGSEAGKGVYICLREELCVDNLRMVHILDFFGDEVDALAGISFIHSYCAENNIHLVDFYCTSTRISRYFTSSGWFSINDDKCFQFPNLFHPLELRDPPTTSLIYWSNSDMLELSDISRLYITKQDADLDRPTLSTFNDIASK